MLRVSAVYVQYPRRRRDGPSEVFCYSPLQATLSGVQWAQQTRAGCPTLCFKAQSSKLFKMKLIYIFAIFRDRRLASPAGRIVRFGARCKKFSTSLKNAWALVGSWREASKGCLKRRSARRRPLRLRSATALRIAGRFEGIGESSESRAIESHDVRAKVYAVLRQLGFDAVRGGLSPEDGVLLEAARCFGTLAETEAWSDVQEELMASPGTRPVSADAARLNATLAELQQGAAPRVCGATE